MKAINKIIFGLFLGIMVFHNSCDEENLDLKPQGETEATYFQEQNDFSRAIRGVYAQLTAIYGYQNNSPKHAMWHLPGDDITTTGSNDFEKFRGLSPANGTINNFFDAVYELINRANTVLQKIENVEEGVYRNKDLKDYHQGEALFLRADMYFRLWNFYGTAPLVTKRIQDSDEIYTSSSEGTELLDQAIKDFEKAAGLLPQSWSDENRGRVTSNSAYGMLGKALVFRGTVNNAEADYQAAIDAINNISGPELMDNFGHNFHIDHENNKESLYEFQASQPQGADNIWLANDFGRTVGQMSAYWGFYENHWSLFGGQPFIPTQKLIDAFNSNDPRVQYTLNPSEQTFLKYWQNGRKSNTGAGSLNNPRILRYADVLLLKAEALVKSGGSTEEAIQLINRIRERARNSANPAVSVPADRDETVTDRDQIMDWIRKERFLELAGEEAHRWWDLRRWHMGGEIDLSNWNFSSELTTFQIDPDTHIRFPIPNNEVDLNPKVQQNPGY